MADSAACHAPVFGDKGRVRVDIGVTGDTVYRDTALGRTQGHSGRERTKETVENGRDQVPETK